VLCIEPARPAHDRVRAYTTIRPQPALTELSADLPAATGLCELNQVHGTTVVEAQHYPAAPEADACYSRSSDWACVVRTADCLPLLLCSRSGDEVAAVHAGWRGLADGVIEATLVQLNTAPEDLLAWMGPAIGPDNFEVGAEVRSAFLKGLTGAARQDASACFNAKCRMAEPDNFHEIIPLPIG
jgi:YfiH family protein